MNAACRDFRRRLERALVGRPAAGELDALAWQEHLLACGDCRALLEAEQVLEELLESLPNPRLSPAAQRRLVDRLRAHCRREAELDSLLELDRVEAPPDLPSRVLASVRARTDESARALADESARARAGASHARTGTAGDEPLDAALDAWCVEPPAGLPERVLAGLAPARGAARESAAPALARRATAARPAHAIRWRALAAAAAVLVLAALAWRLARDAGAPPSRDGASVARGEAPAGGGTDAAGDPGREDRGTVGLSAAPDEELLANLDVLETWDVLLREDVDLLLASYEPADEALLEWDAEPAESAEDSAADATPDSGGGGG